MCLRGLVIAAWAAGLSPQLAAAQELVLYENDFETPNQPITVDCGNSLDQSGVNAIFGRAGYSFVEDFTVDAVVLHDPAGKYGDPGTRNGKYALGMLGQVQNDRLALRFDVQSQPFLNLTMDVSSIDVEGCAGPFGVETPRFELTLLDSPDGLFDWNAKQLDAKTLEGVPSKDAWSFAWSRATVALDASKATDGNVILVFDLVSDGYAVFDNLRITATRLAAVADRDEDGVPDATDNCPNHANGNQANLDLDTAGDACDPAAMNPERCGDRGGDGTDDCLDFCETHSVPGCAKVEAGAGAGGSGGARPHAGRGGSPSERDLDASVEEEAPRTPRWGGGGPGATAASPEDEGGGCGIIRTPGDRAPVALVWLSAILVTCVRRCRRRG